MLVGSAILLTVLTWNNGYSLEKTAIIGMMCIFKFVDVVEDLYVALYQRYGRLDVGAKCMTLRLILTLIVFAGLTAVTRDLLLSLSISTLFSIGILIWFLSMTYSEFRVCGESESAQGKERSPFKIQISLLWVCAPLFVGTFLQFYLGNAPRYAIDSVLNDNAQAQFGFLYMPNFVIVLFSGFIFTPIIKAISEMWYENKIGKFRSVILKQMLFILIISLVCIGVGYCIGIPVLGFLYNTDLSAFRMEFIILLIGGGFFAATSFFAVILTIIRCQKDIMIGYAVASVCAFLLLGPAIQSRGIMGAAIIYFVLSAGVTVFFWIVVWVQVRRRSRLCSNY
jgi:O-antigen/teichoic acid export membrane protein